MRFKPGRKIGAAESILGMPEKLFPRDQAPLRQRVRDRLASLWRACTCS
jgi:hypothetical protein